RAQKGNPSIKRSKLDRSYARRASIVQDTTGLDLGGFTTWKKSHWYTQEEGIDYDEVFAPVDRIEAIRLFLAYASFKDFVVYQMDVKSAFLYGKIEEEVYVCQPPGFEDPEFPDRVYKIDKTLFIKRVKSDILLVQVYVDDIIFVSTKNMLCTEFEKLMHKKFQMISIGELTFFLGLQVTQKDDGIFINQDKYVDEILKKFGFSTVKTASTPMETSKPLLKDAEAEDVDVYLYRSMICSLMYLTSSRPDIMFAVCDYARFQVTPKVSHLHAVKRIFRYLKGQPKLGLWYPKDSPFDLEDYSDSDYAGQTIVANSTSEAEYVAAASCCGQVLWIQNQIQDYGYNFMNTKIFIDNESTLCIVKNPVFHSKTKHIEIRHHFIRDSNEKKLIQMIKIHTDQNVADLLTKAFDVGRFQYLIATANDEIQVSVVGLTFYWHKLTTAGKVNAVRHTLNTASIQALVDGNKVIVIETSVRRALQLKYVEGTECLSNATIFAELERMGFIEWRTQVLSSVEIAKLRRRTARLESSEDGRFGVCVAQEDASKQGRKIVDLDVIQKIKAAKPKAVTTAATTTTTVVTRSKARGVLVQEPNSFVPMDTKIVEGSKSQAEVSKKRIREELESDNSKKKKIDENLEDRSGDEAEE
ncbi:putative ribonuclease H-like domain-containing protein, partial [Tanacetum coccineum]